MVNPRLLEKSTNRLKNDCWWKRKNLNWSLVTASKIKLKHCKKLNFCLIQSVSYYDKQQKHWFVTLCDNCFIQYKNLYSSHKIYELSQKDIFYVKIKNLYDHE